MKRISKFPKPSKKRILFWGGVLGAGLGTLGFWKLLLYHTGAESLSANSVVISLVFILLLAAYAKLEKLPRAETIFAWLFSALLAVVLIIGAQLEFYSDIFWSFATLTYIFCTVFLVYPPLSLLIAWLGRAPAADLKKFNYAKLYWISFAIIFVGGVLVWLALYPGIYGFDSSIQVAQQLEPEEEVLAQWSLPLGWLLGLFFRLGQSLFGSYQAGLAIAMFLQMLVMTFIAAKITLFAASRSKSRVVYLFSLLFFTIFPFYTVMTVYSAQDVLFSGALVLIVINLFEMADNKEYWKKPYLYPLELFLLCVALCVMRKNGVYCLVAALVFTLIFYKEKRWLAAGLLFVPIVGYYLYDGPVISALGIANGSTQREMLSVPAQQLVRTYNNRPDVFSEEDLAELHTYFDNFDNFKFYEDYPSIADFSKGALDRNNLYSEGGVANLLKFWLKIGLRAPAEYVEAFLMNNYGLWYPNKQLYDLRQFIAYQEFWMSTFPTDRGYDYLAVERDSKFPLYRDFLQQVVEYNAWNGAPVLSLLFTLGSYFLILLFAIGLTLVRKNWKHLIPLAALLGLAATVLMGPVMSYRYGFALVLALPVLIGAVLCYNRKHER